MKVIDAIVYGWKCEDMLHRSIVVKRGEWGKGERERGNMGQSVGLSQEEHSAHLAQVLCTTKALPVNHLDMPVCSKENSSLLLGIVYSFKCVITL